MLGWRTRAARRRMLCIGVMAFAGVACRESKRESSLTIVAARDTLAAGDSLQLTTRLDGREVDSSRRVNWTTSNPLVATVDDEGIVRAKAGGSVTIRGVIRRAGQSSIRLVVQSATPVEPVVTVDTSRVFQTMWGWQSTTQNGWLDCDSTAFLTYRDALHDRAVEELGINRITIALRSSSEGTDDSFSAYRAGHIDFAEYKRRWFVSTNDNGDPFTADTSRFHWGFVDGQVEQSVLPLRDRLQRRGERLFVVLHFVDFIQPQVRKGFDHMAEPEEYAELVVEAFKHLQRKYGLVPDAYELILEPEHTPHSAVEIGRALVATVRRLRAAGFSPAMIAPSTTSMAGAVAWYDTLTAVPGARGLVSELGYHRYTDVTHAAHEALAERARRDGVRPAMLEHIGSGIDDLFLDVTVAQATAWQQFTLAYCGEREDRRNRSVYYSVNQKDRAHPRILLTDDARLLAQLFRYVRLGAVRVGAETGDANRLRPMAFRNVDGRLAVVVRTSEGVSFSVGGLGRGRFGVNYAVARGRWNVALPDIEATNGAPISVTMPDSGVITIFRR